LKGKIHFVKKGRKGRDNIGKRKGKKRAIS